MPADDAVTGFARVEAQPEELEESGPAADRVKGDDEMVVAGALRAPWKWEKLIVDSAVIGGDPERWRRRLRGLRGEFDGQLREAQREDPDSARVGQIERDIDNLAHLTGLRPAAHRRAGGLAAERDVGRMARTLHRAGAARAAPSGSRPAGARRAAADGGGRPGLARRGARHSRGTPADARRTAAGESLRLRLRRHAAAAARPRLRHRLRAFARRAAVPAEAARGSDAARRRDARAARRRAVRPGGSSQERAPDAAPRGRRGDDAAVAVVSAARRQRRAAARAVVLHARRHARDHRPHPATRRAAAARGGGGRREARLAGAGGCRARRSTRSSTTSRRCAS